MIEEEERLKGLMKAFQDHMLHDKNCEVCQKWIKHIMEILNIEIIPEEG